MTDVLVIRHEPGRAAYRKNVSIDDLRRLYVDGRESQAQIAARFGVTEGLIHSRLKDAKIPSHPTGPRPELTINIPVETWKLGYTAGIVDGEGTIGFMFCDSNSSKRYPIVAVKNTHTGMLNWLVDTFGEQFYLSNKVVKPWHHTGYRWCLNGEWNIYAFLKAIEPYLIIKKANAAEVMDFCAARLRAYGCLEVLG